MLFPLFLYRFSAFRASATGRIPDVRGMFMVSDFILQDAELDLEPDFSKEGVRFFFPHIISSVYRTSFKSQIACHKATLSRILPRSL